MVSCKRNRALCCFLLHFFVPCQFFSFFLFEMAQKRILKYIFFVKNTRNIKYLFKFWCFRFGLCVRRRRLWHHTSRFHWRRKTHLYQILSTHSLTDFLIISFTYTHTDFLFCTKTIYVGESYKKKNEKCIQLILITNGSICTYLILSSLFCVHYLVLFKV